MLLFVALVVYLLGSFQHFILETAHTISHQFCANHSYHSHQLQAAENDHQHANLDLSKAIFKDHSNSPIPQDNTVNFSFKKVPQICNSTYLLSDWTDEQNKSNIFYQSQMLPTIYLQKLFSPPDFV